jgi:hypothetical protein
MESLTILGTTALMASSLTHWTHTITSPTTFGPLAKNSFGIAQILFATFYFII